MTEPGHDPGDGAHPDRERLMRELAVGQVRRGVVTEVMEFGARVDLGGVTGLLLIVDMSWTERMYPVTGHCAVGDEIDVRVLDIDWSVGRLSLGVKQLVPNPWTGVEERFPVGRRVRGPVVALPRYGAFVELEPHVWALIPAAELRASDSGRTVKLGDVLDGVVTRVDEAAEKITVARPA